jgi:F-type H+-transporting ATPase subunit b
MRRLILCSLAALFLLLGMASGVRAEEKAPTAAGGTTGREVWEWANFIVLVGALGYFVGKRAGPAFDARGRRIRKEMVEAEQIRKDAEIRALAVEARLARLAEEIAALRAEAQREEQAEHERYARHVAAEIGKIQEHAQQEIEAAGKAAIMELKRQAAVLSLQLAERQIRARMTPETEDRLVRGFLRNLEVPPSAAQAD